MSLLGSGMGTAAHRVLAKNARAATIIFDAKFISASTMGDLLLGTAKVLRKTRPLVFMGGEIRCGEQLIATPEGIWKVIYYALVIFLDKQAAWKYKQKK